MKTKLLLFSLLFSAIGISQGTTSNRMVGIAAEPGFTFYTDGDLAEFQLLDLDIYGGYAIAVNPSDSLTYALIGQDDEANRDLFLVNPFTGEIELIFDFDINYFNSADIGSDGKVYLITGNAADVPGQIYRLDASSGDFELLFDTGLEGPWGLEYNTSNNSIYIFRGNDGEPHFVYRYDPESGEFTEMPLDGAEEVEVHGAFYIEEEDKFYITGYSGEIIETVSPEYNVTEPVFFGDYTTMDVCIIQTLRAEGPVIDMDACPGDDSTKIELLYAVNDVEWYRDGVLIAGADDEFYYAKTSGDYQARMQIGDTDNYMLSETITVNFFTVPVVTVSQEEDDHFLCPGETIILDGAAPGGGSVQWLLNGELIADAIEATYEATLPGVYNQMKTNLSGCSDTAAVSFVIEASPVPFVELTIDGDEFLCPEETIDITGLGDGDIQWYLNGLAIDGATEASILISEGGVYNQYVINEFGCADSAAVGITITSADNPVVEVTADDLILCTEESVTIEGTGDVENQWYKDGILIDGETGASLEATEAGIYNLLVINEFGCADSAAVGVIIEMGEVPTVEITNVDDDHLICPLEAIVLDGASGTEMQWFKDGVAIMGETASNYTAFEPGSYNQLVTIADGCSNEADEDYLIEVDPDCDSKIEENQAVEIKFYPNPVLDNLTISSDALITDIIVYDVAGAIVIELHNASTKQVILNYDDLESGVYLVNVTTNQGVSTIKTQK